LQEKVFLQENMWHILVLQLLQLLQLLQINAAKMLQYDSLQPLERAMIYLYCTNKRRVNRDEYFYFLEKKVCLSLHRLKKKLQNMLFF
jgi:hypothetical protein